MAPAYLLLSWFHLQDVMFPNGVEHAALPAEVSETLFFIVPVHLHNIRKHKFTVTVFNYLSNDSKCFHLSGQAQDKHGQTLHNGGVLLEQ